MKQTFFLITLLFGLSSFAGISDFNSLIEDSIADKKKLTAELKTKVDTVSADKSFSRHNMARQRIVIRDPKTGTENIAVPTTEYVEVEAEIRAQKAKNKLERSQMERLSQELNVLED